MQDPNAHIGMEVMKDEIAKSMEWKGRPPCMSLLNMANRSKDTTYMYFGAFMYYIAVYANIGRICLVT